MKNITLDRTAVLQLDADGTDGALDAAADCDVLRNDAALDLCAIADKASRRHVEAEHLRGLRVDRQLVIAWLRPGVFRKLWARCPWRTSSPLLQNLIFGRDRH
jgi:hypothetical protein